MTTDLINLSQKIRDPGMVETYRSVHACAEALGIPYLIVGASARDLVMHHAFGAAIKRATSDIDFAIQVADWDAVEALRQTLAQNSFETTAVHHRLRSNSGIPVDIVPFGDIADAHAIIKMPPNEFPMNVRGFSEALTHAYSVSLSESPALIVKVASPEGMLLLKFIAWADREKDKRGKDAADIAYLLENLEELTPIAKLMYDDQPLMEQYDHDLKLACAHHFGGKVFAMAEPETAEVLQSIFESHNEKLGMAVFLHEMNRHGGYRSSEQLLNAFIAGFNSANETERSDR